MTSSVHVEVCDVSRVLLVLQFEIQFYHIHTRFAQQAEGTAFSVFNDHLSDDFFVHAAGFRYSANLVLSSSGTDMWIKATGR